MNPIDREILVLRFVAELEFQEIADIMHMGLSATKCGTNVLLINYVRNLRARLKLSA